MDEEHKDIDSAEVTDSEIEQNADDVAFVPEEDEEASPEARLKKLRDKFKACDAEKRQALEDLQRARAEFLNAKRIQDEQTKREHERAIERFIEELLPVIDSFDLALAGPGWDAADPTWKKGIENIHAQLMSILARHQVHVIADTNVPLDPREHEAVSGRPEEGVQTDTVIEVFQKGYKRNDYVIRPAKVVVSV